MRPRASFLRVAVPGVLALILVGCYRSASQQSGPIQSASGALPASTASPEDLAPAAREPADPAGLELAAGTIAVVLAVPGMD